MPNPIHLYLNKICTNVYITNLCDVFLGGGGMFCCFAWLGVFFCCSFCFFFSFFLFFTFCLFVLFFYFVCCLLGGVLWGG